MLESDFDDSNIDNFTPKEIVTSGAELKDVKLETMIRIQKYRILIRRPVYIPENGITSGKHKAPWHPMGLAIDTWLHPKHGPIKSLDVFKCALEAGFKAIGIYWNGKLWSFHFDLRPNYAFWCGVKKYGDKRWQYHTLINDPSKIPVDGK